MFTKQFSFLAHFLGVLSCFLIIGGITTSNMESIVFGTFYLLVVIFQRRSVYRD